MQHFIDGPSWLCNRGSMRQLLASIYYVQNVGPTFLGSVRISRVWCAGSVIGGEPKAATSETLDRSRGLPSGAHFRKSEDLARKFTASSFISSALAMRPPACVRRQDSFDESPARRPGTFQWLPHQYSILDRVCGSTGVGAPALGCAHSGFIRACRCFVTEKHRYPRKHRYIKKHRRRQAADSRSKVRNTVVSNLHRQPQRLARELSVVRPSKGRELSCQHRVTSRNTYIGVSIQPDQKLNKSH